MISVKDSPFKAKGDGKTDDTAAIQAAYDQAALLMAKQGGAGVVYFPESDGYYKVSDLHIPSMGYDKGWLTSVFDNGLLVSGSIYPSRGNAFIGRTSNYAGMGGSFVWGPFAEWQKVKGTSGPVVDMAGTQGVNFQGIAFANANGGTSVHMHDTADSRGCVWTTFKECAFMDSLLIDCAGTNGAGFGLRMYQCSVAGKIDMTGPYGDITIRDSYVHRIVSRKQTGNIILEGILSESLNNQDFFEWHSNFSDSLVMTRVEVADSTNAYLLKLVNDGTPHANWTPNIKVIHCQPGAGILNPHVTGANPCIWAEGDYADLSACRSMLYQGASWKPKYGLALYGSPWLTNPLTVNGKAVLLGT